MCVCEVAFSDPRLFSNCVISMFRSLYWCKSLSVKLSELTIVCDVDRFTWHNLFKCSTEK